MKKISYLKIENKIKFIFFIIKFLNLIRKIFFKLEKENKQKKKRIIKVVFHVFILILFSLIKLKRTALIIMQLLRFSQTFLKFFFSNKSQPRRKIVGFSHLFVILFIYKFFFFLALFNIEQ